MLPISGCAMGLFSLELLLLLSHVPGCPLNTGLLCTLEDNLFSAQVRSLPAALSGQFSTTTVTGLQWLPDVTSNSWVALRAVTSAVENSAIIVLLFFVKHGCTYPFHSCILILPSEACCCSILCSHAQSIIQCSLNQGLDHGQHRPWQSLPFSPAFPLAQRETALVLLLGVTVQYWWTQTNTRDKERVWVWEWRKSELTGRGMIFKLLQERRISRHTASTKVFI